MEGWLSKKGGFAGRQWQPRYCTIDGFMLRWYADQRKDDCKGCVDVRGTSIIPSESNLFNVEGAQVEKKGGSVKTYSFQSQVTWERDAWVLALRAAAAANPMTGAASADSTVAAENAARVYVESLSTMGQNYASIGMAMKAKEGANSATHIQALFNTGVVLYLGGNVVEAVKQWQTLLQIDPNHADTRFNLGMVKYASGDVQGAMDELDFAIDSLPNHAPAILNRGLIRLHNKQDVQGALADYNKVLEIKSTHCLALISRANLKITHLEDKQGAFDDYNRAVESGTFCGAAFYNRGLYRMQFTSDWRAAIMDFSKAAEHDPGCAMVYTLRGILKAEHGDEKGAVPDFQTALQLNPKDVLALNYRGVAKLKQSDFEAAEADFQAALAVEPDNILTRAHVEKLRMAQAAKPKA